jgi:serine protease Do
MSTQNRYWWWSAAAVMGAVALAASTLALADKLESKPNMNGVTLNLPVAETPVARDAVPRGSYASIVKRVAPAVVKIEITATLTNSTREDWFGLNEPFLKRFFGDQFGHIIPQQPPGPLQEQGVGSGVIVTQDGYILTNNHVVDNADKVKVTLPDGREFIAKVVGRDPKSDVAVIKIPAKGLPVVDMADSDKVEVGDVALAVGNPFGVGETVTAGIISATGRANLGLDDYEDFLQTDAAINPGNSGGALVDIDGRLIGINTAILSHSGGSQGVGLAIPSNLARTIMESLVRYGKVTRGYLGVMIQSVTPELATEFDLKSRTGALVGDVVPKGPAARAGIMDGDVILKYDGTQVADSQTLRMEVAGTTPGTTVPLEIWRNASTKKLEVKVAVLPGTHELAQNNSSSNDNSTLNGVSVADLTTENRQQMKVPDDVSGALITSVDPNSASAAAGLQAGEVIEEINRHTVKDADDAMRLTEHAKDKHTLVRVWSPEGSHYIVVDESLSG